MEEKENETVIIKNVQCLQVKGQVTYTQDNLSKCQTLLQTPTITIQRCKITNKELNSEYNLESKTLLGITDKCLKNS